MEDLSWLSRTQLLVGENALRRIKTMLVIDYFMVNRDVLG